MLVAVPTSVTPTLIRSARITMPPSKIGSYASQGRVLWEEDQPAAEHILVAARS